MEIFEMQDAARNRGAKDGLQATVLSPRAPTWRRYFEIFIKNRKISVFRALTYEIISTLRLSGRVLDFGGGSASSYVPLLGDNFVYESADISPRLKPTYVLEVGAPFPIRDEHFENIIAFNVLEHIFSVRDTIAELNRVLRPDGGLHIVVPFLFPVHGAPYDYNRFTAQWWIDTLHELGFNEIVVDPILWDAFSVGLGMHWQKSNLLARLLMPLPELILAKARGIEKDGRYLKGRADYVSKFAIGYFICAKKVR